MKFGLSDTELATLHEKIVTPLSQAGAKVYCYGSRARGDHRKFSDIDIMVESNSDLSQQLAKIREEFENSNFPLKVDLVEFRHFAESYKSCYFADRKTF